jgi:hypothetical protein
MNFPYEPPSFLETVIFRLTIFIMGGLLALEMRNSIIAYLFILALLEASTVTAWEPWTHVIIQDKSGDVKISNFGALPNVSVSSIDISEVEITLKGGIIEVAFYLNGYPLRAEDAGLGNRSRYMFSYTLMAPVLVNKTPAYLTVSYDNVVPSINETSSLSIVGKGISYVSKASVHIEGTKLVITGRAPHGFQGFTNGTVTAMALIQSSKEALTGAIDEAEYVLGVSKETTTVTQHNKVSG